MTAQKTGNILPRLGNWSFAGADSKVEIDGALEYLNWEEDSAPGKYICRNASGQWFLEVIATADKFTLKCRAELCKQAVHLKLMLPALPPFPADHVLCGGIKMGRCHAFKMPVFEPQEFTSYYTCTITANAASLQISHPLDQSQYAMIEGKVSGGSVELAVCSEVHHYALRTIEFPPVTFRNGNGIRMLEEYAGENVETERTFAAPVCGWNSWDYYRWTISEKEVLKNAEFIASDPVLSKHVKRIIVDDGWQYCYGEWHANCLFPSGMKALAAELRRMKFTPGIWLAPSIIEPHSRIAQLDYDMLACSEGGQPCLSFDCMRRKGFVLDPTVAKSQKFLRELFDRMVNEGYEYFKLDFLERTMDARKFADPNIPRSRILRMLMQSICDGVAGRAEILGCNYAFMTGNKYVTAARVGSDIHATWQGAQENALNVAYRFWMNKKLWINDPDFALCRGVETSDHPETLQPVLVFCEPDSQYDPFYSQTFASARKNELEVLLSVTLMSGGAVNLSDDLTKLNEDGLDLARKVVSAESGEAAIPLDICSSARPARWLQKLAGGGRALLINWKDQEQEMAIDFPELPSRVKNFWKGTWMTVPDTVILPPHSCLLMEW